MKQLILLTAMTLVLPFTANAQDDDLYFVPSKKKVEEKSNVKTDDYSNWNQSYDIMPDSDIIVFDGAPGIYPDSIYMSTELDNKTWKDFAKQYNEDNEDEYTFSRQLDRWYGVYDPWFYSPSYWGYRHGWYSPYYSSWAYRYYDPWMWGFDGLYSFYDPWYYGSYYNFYGWTYPGYLNYGWHNPWYYGGYWGGYYGGYWGNTWGWGGHIGGGGHHDYAHTGGNSRVNRGSAQSGGASVASVNYGTGRRSGSAQVGTRSTSQSQGYTQSAQGTGSYGSGSRSTASSTTGVGRRDYSSSSSNYNNSSSNYNTTRSSSSSSSNYNSSRSSSASSGSYSGGSRSSSASSYGGGSSSGGGARSGGGSAGGGGRR